MRAAVVVLGDIGRSPRMRYHAQALAAQGVDVDLVGYVDTELPDQIRQSPAITVQPLRDTAPPSIRAGAGMVDLLRTAWRGSRLFLRLLALLAWRLDRPDLILVQNPPGVPTLTVAWLAARLRSARLVIDWHNFTYSMLSLRFGQMHWLVRLVKRHERWIGRRADGHLFVSAAMQQALASDWGLQGTVFRDRPSPEFRPLSTAERDRVRSELFERLDIRPDERGHVLAVSPTSWTADEDFDLLLDAVAGYDTRAKTSATGSTPPRLVILLTGRGPLRERFERRFADLQLTHVLVRPLWLASGEYPTMLAAADLGICVHRSASGIDLPMKIADMFGVGIPVCALNYGPCLSELVRHKENGLLFSTADELAQQLCELVAAGPEGAATLTRLAAAVRAERGPDWQAAWVSEVWPVVEAVGR